MGNGSNGTAQRSRCDVRGCPREGVFTLTRTLRDDRGVPQPKTLRYCAEHYSQSNRRRAELRRA